MAVVPTRYHDTAARLRAAIAGGAFPPGTRLPSVRALARQWCIAVNTAVAAYRLLEREGAVAAVPRSGFVVQPPRTAESPRTPAAGTAPAAIDVAGLMRQWLQARDRPGAIDLSVAVPPPALLPLAPLRRHLAAVQRDEPEACLGYDAVPGRPELRLAIARRLAAAGAAVDTDAVTVTNGAQEALQLALRAVCPPGATVAVETPAYPGLIQAIAAQGLQALEIPAASTDGLSLPALRLALDEHAVAAVLCTAAFSNPGGGCMPPAARRELVELCRVRGVALIDDDTYGELAHDGSRAAPCLAHDRDGLVVHVGSFSKCIAPGLRLGFVVGGRWSARIQGEKVAASIASAVAPQLAVARLLDDGGFDRHRRRSLPRLGEAVARCAAAVRAGFPTGTRVSQPAGGFVLWVELPARCDAARLHRDALAAGIGIAPGQLFSPRGRFRHHIRITAGRWDGEVERALAMVGRMAGHQAR